MFSLFRFRQELLLFAETLSLLLSWRLLAVAFAGSMVLVGIGFFLQSRTPLDRIGGQLLALPPDDIEGAVKLLRQLPDPIERGLAADQWIRQNRGKTDTAKAVALCNQLREEQIQSCVRHLYAAHLRR